MRQLLRAISLVGCVSLLFACSSGTSPSQSGGTLRVGVPEDFASLDPHNASGETPSVWLSLIYETLVGIDKTANPVPGLAKSWQISPDGLTYTFHLRDDVKFHNGRKFTSKDVEFNFNKIKDPASKAVDQAEYALITSMDTPDNLTLVLHLVSADGSLLSHLALQARGGIVAPESYDASGKMINYIGTGPYKFVSYAQADRLEMVRNAEYWGGAANINAITVRIIPDATARLQAINSGQLDFVWAAPAADGLQLAKDGNFQMKQIPENRGDFFSINVTKAPFNDVRVRQALFAAVSRKDIAQAGWNGYAAPTDQPFEQSSPWYIQRPMSVDADTAKAKQLLADSGVKNLKVTILQWDALGSDQEAQIVASAWSQLGVQTTIQKVDIATLVKRASTGDFDVVYLWIGLITDPSRPYDFFASKSNRNGIVGLLKSPQLDAWVKQGHELSDGGARKSVYSQLLDYNYQQAAQFYTVNPTQYVAVSKHLKNYEQSFYYVYFQKGGLLTATLSG